MFFFGQSLLLFFLLQLPSLQEILSLFFESILVEGKLLSHKFSSKCVEFGVDFELFVLNQVALLENLLDCVLSVLLVQPLVLGDFVVVYLVVENVLLLGLGFVPFN